MAEKQTSRDGYSNLSIKGETKAIVDRNHAKKPKGFAVWATIHELIEAGDRVLNKKTSKNLSKKSKST